jgi:alpha-glucosidase
MLADYPENYRGTKELAFLKAVPVTWNETRVLSGMPGEHIVIARRKGKDWYVGAITNESARNVDVPLSMLGSGSYSIEKYEDSGITAGSVSSGSTLDIKMSSSGGAAYVLRAK